MAGLNLARALSRKNIQVVLLDKHNYHTFQPLLYQVATAGLEPDSIAYPFRKIFKRQERFFFRLTDVESIDMKAKKVCTSIGELTYDYLVLATGSQTNFFGLEDVERHGMSMKEIPEALDIRSLILQNFERALLSNDLDEREALMNVIIVGGGPTGVELAGAISELRRHVLPQDYPDLDVRKMTIHVVEAAPRVLASMSEKASEKALQFLEKMDVQVWLDTRVKSYDGLNAEAHGGTKILGQTLDLGRRCTRQSCFGGSRRLEKQGQSNPSRRNESFRTGRICDWRCGSNDFRAISLRTSNAGPKLRCSRGNCCLKTS